MSPTSHRIPPAAGVALLLVAAVLVWTRVVQLPLGFWNDEAYSAWNYIDPGPKEALFGRYLPNNHLLFSLLTWGTTRIFGRAESIYRVWSVVPALAAVAVLATWSLRRFGPWVAVAFAVLATISEVHLDLAPQARGYGLGFLSAALLPVAADLTSRERTRRRGFALFGVAGAIGIWTLPVFVLPFLVQAAVIASDRRRIVATTAVVGALGFATLLLFAPLLSGILEASRQSFGAPLAWTSVLSGPCVDLACPGMPFPEIDPAGPLAVAVIWLLAGIGAWRLARSGERVVLASLLLPVLGTYVALVALGLNVVPRFVSYLLLDVLLLVAFGVVEIVSRLRPWRPAQAVVISAFSILAAIGLVHSIRTAAEWSVTPIEGYREAVSVAVRSGIPDVYSNARGFGTGFLYYAHPVEILFPAASELERTFCRSTGPFVYLHYPLYGDPVDTTCLRERHATEVPIPQRAGGRGGWISVYVVKP